LSLCPPCLPAIGADLSPDSQQRREPVAHVTVWGFEVDERIVATVNSRNDNASCTEIYSDLHK